MSFVKHRRLHPPVEIRPYVPGESLRGVYKLDTHTPKLGDFVARDPEMHIDSWFMTRETFIKHFDPEPIE